MNPTTPQPVNGGQPLNQQQINQYRSGLGINTQNPLASTTSQADPWASFNAAMNPTTPAQPATQGSGKGFLWDAAGNLINGITSSEQGFGQDLSTIGSSAPKTASDINAQTAVGEQKLLEAAHNETDPNKKAQILSAYQSIYGKVAPTTAGDINPAFNKTPEQVVGDAGGVALDALSGGTYGEAAKGAETGKLLTSAAPTAISAVTDAAKGGKGLVQGAIKGAQEGALVGAGVGTAYGADQGLKNNQNAGGVMTSAAEGGLTGAAGGAVLGGGAGAIKGGVETMAANAADRATAKTAQAQSDLESQALKDATPAYNKKLVGEPAIKNPDGTVTPRVVEGGLKGRTVTPTALETDAGTALSKIEGYPTNGTALEKYQAVAPEIAKQGQALRASLANETVVRTRGEMMDIVKKAVNGVPENSMSLSKTDPIISNYLRVASNAVDGKSQSLAGELEFSNKLDQAYENARGKLAFGSDKISALDEIHTAARNALKQDLINSAENTDVKAALKSQWDLYRAQDVLRDKAEAEGGTSIERQMQKHPVITKIAKGAVHASGLGAAIHLIP